MPRVAVITPRVVPFYPTDSSVGVVHCCCDIHHVRSSERTTFSICICLWS